MATKVDESKGPVPAAILIDELRNDDLQVRLNSVKKLTFIADVLGPTRTRDELVPYLYEFIDDEDDLLLALAEELGNLIGQVGGPPHAHVLLVPLEGLCAVEESSVRDKAVEAINKITAVLPQDSLLKHVVPLIQKLGSGEWFTTRVSATGLFAATYPRVDEQIRTAFRNLYCDLCKDETPMVRRAACSNMNAFVKVLDAQSLKAEILPALTKLTTDDQDSVRLLTVENCITIANSLKREENLRLVLPLMQSLCKDKSWRVRYIASDKICEMMTSLGKEEAKGDELVDSFVQMLSDPEAEVRTAGANRVAEVAKMIGPPLTLKKLVKPCQALATDASPYTRAALAKVVMGMAAVIPRQDVYDTLLPLFLQLLKDQHSEVRLNIISRLDEINRVVGVELLSQSLLPAIGELSQDQKWRVRLAIIEHIPTLAQQLGVRWFEEKISDLCMDWLGDQVHCIRVAATNNLTKLAQVFGVQWAQSHILPKVVNLGVNQSYLYRMTALTAIADLAAVMGTDNTSERMLPVVLRMASDPVPNVRFNVSKTLQKLLPYLTVAAMREKVRPCLQRLMQDPDIDVQYYSRVAYEATVNAEKGGPAPMVVDST